jgi:hypothetical protein
MLFVKAMYKTPDYHVTKYLSFLSSDISVFSNFKEESKVGKTSKVKSPSRIIDSILEI